MITRNYKIGFTETPPKIDGLIVEEVWQKAAIASDFKQNTPHPDQPPTKKTEVKLVYDNEAIYIAARMYDNPDSIFNYLTERDEVGNADFFFVAFNNYRDGINGEGFIVMPSGVQLDTKYTADGESIDWDAVWESATHLDDLGWTVEMKIPFSALRFPEVEKQTWWINFGREIRRNRERSYWSNVSPTVDGFLTQSGVLQGIENIKSPTRLFFFPYASSYVEHNSANGGSDSYSFNAGMDIKYGLNDAFTLDMTLIPDFGQARFDNQVLNLSQFEVQFNENRQFFTEGVELFNKAGLFYSRRIGGTPYRYFQLESALDSTDEIVDNPPQGQLLNATKISGRNKNGLGIGFFNALENKEEAEIKNTETGEKRRFTTNPLTNYNVIVLDQVLRSNSFLTFTNTNVTREGEARDANVSKLDLKLADKKIRYAVLGDYAQSFVFNENNTTSSGHKWSAGVEKISGNFLFGVNREVISDEYNPNDLGFQTINNITRDYAFGQFVNYKPKNFNFWRHTFDAVYERLYKPSEFVNLASTWSTVYGMKSFHAFGLNAGVEPINTNDFFETRSFEQYYKYPKNFWYGGFFSSDYSRVFAGDIRLQHRVFDEENRFYNRVFLSVRLQPNDRIFFVTDYTKEKSNNEIGYAGTSNLFASPDSILLGRRDIDVHVSAIRASYIFNNKMALKLDLRHYWSTATYDKLYDLNPDNGDLIDIGNERADVAEIQSNNRSFNAFNIDLGFSWRFAPGSDINVVWKNIISYSGDPMERNYFRDLDQTLAAPQINNLSIKVLYFIDYLSLKRS